MSIRINQIGLDRAVRLKWLDQTATMVLAGNDIASIKLALQDDLKDSFRSVDTTVRGSLDKTITILTKIWLKPPAVLEQLRLEGLDLLTTLSRADRLAVHWGMVMAVYPFWASVAAQVGRLFRLQGSASAVHVQRRLREQYGERETVSRRARYVLRSYVDWGVLREAGAMGLYNACPSLAIDDSRLIAWLVEASLHARSNGAAPLTELIESPSLFPFRVKRIAADHLRAMSSHLDFVRHDLDSDLVMLRRRPNTETFP